MPKPIVKLKDQARLCEQREEWERAAHLYQQVLRTAEQEGDIATELGLYNRVGDIYLRLGRPQDAVIFFEQAADHYAADGLYNNAIALCNKALRHVPGRLELYRKLGRLSASQGFATEARRWFLEYAERNLRQGALEEAFGALGELADLTDDPEVRELLARQLHSHGRSVEAVDEFRRAYATRLRAGDRAGADAVRDEVQVLDAAAAEALGEELEAAPDLAGPMGGLPLLEEFKPRPPEVEEEAASAEAPGLQAEAIAPASPAEDEARAAAEAAIAAALVEEALALAPATDDERAAAASRLEGFDPTLLGDVSASAAGVIRLDLERPEEVSLEDVPPLPDVMLGGETFSPGEEPPPLPLPLLEVGEAPAAEPDQAGPPLPLLLGAGSEDGALAPEPTEPEMPASELALAPAAAVEQAEPEGREEPLLEDVGVIEPPGPEPGPEFSLDLNRREPGAEPLAPELLLQPAALSEAIEEIPAAETPAPGTILEPAALSEAIEEPAAETPGSSFEPAALSEAIEDLVGETPAPDSIIEPAAAPLAALNLELPSREPSGELPAPGAMGEAAADWGGALEPIGEAPAVAEFAPEAEPPIELTAPAPMPAPPDAGVPVGEVFLGEIPGLEPATEPPSPMELVAEPPASDLPGLERDAEPLVAFESLGEAPAVGLPGLELEAESSVAFESLGQVPAVGLDGLELIGEPPTVEATGLERVEGSPAGLEPVGEAPGAGLWDRLMEPVPGLELDDEARLGEPPEVVAEASPGLEPIGEAPVFEEPPEAIPAHPEPGPSTFVPDGEVLPVEWLGVGPVEATAPVAPTAPAESAAPAEPWSVPSEELPWASPPGAASAAEGGAWATEFEAPAWPAPSEPAAEPLPVAELAAQAPPADIPAPDGSESAHADGALGPSGADENAAATGDLPDDPVVLFARSLYAHGQPAAGRVALKQLLTDSEKRGESPRMLAVLEALTELEPADVDLHERRVALSFQLHGPRQAVPALLALAGALERAGQGTRASAVYQQVLDIDPSNALAGTALRRERAGRPRSEHEGGYVDLGALLQSEEDLPPETTRFVVSEAEPTGDEERDFVEMLEQFKEKVAQHMGEDPNAHYDLGLAYKEMGLLDEAVAEFQVALRNGQDRLKVLEELGRCFLLKEEPRIAARLLSQALAVPGRAEVEYMGVNYLLGRSYEAIGETDAARDAYERVIGVDIQFNDVAERLARL